MIQAILSRSTIALKATKLSTPRTIQVSLGNTNTATFDGTANVNVGVSGTLPLARGGTGVSATNVEDLKNKLGLGDGTTIAVRGKYTGTGKGNVSLTPAVNVGMFIIIDTSAFNSYTDNHKEISYAHKHMCIAMGELTETVCVDDTESESVGHVHLYRTRVSITGTNNNQVTIMGDFDTNTLDMIYGNYSATYSFNASGHKYEWIAIGVKL